MSRIRILQLGPYPPPRGGVQTNMLSIHDELLNRGHDSRIIAITKSLAIASESHVEHPTSPFSLIWLILTIPHDVIHVHIGGQLSFRVKMMMLACTVFSRGKKFVTFHSGGYVTSDEGRNANKRSLTGFIFRRFDKVIVVNESMKEMFLKFGLDNVKIRLILPYSLKLPDPNVAIPEDIKEFFSRFENVLVTVGLFETDYDIPLQIEALEKIINAHPSTGLIIVGAGSLLTQITDQIREKGCADHILLAGDTDREIVLHVIQKADVLLRTTLFDGDAISVREALFLGTPVVATDNGLRPKGLSLIPIGDQSALEKAVILLLKDKVKTKPTGAKGNDNIAKVIDEYKNALK